MKNLFYYTRKLTLGFLLVSICFLLFQSCANNKKSKGPEKYLGKWQCSQCEAETLVIKKYGDNFTVEPIASDGYSYGVLNASYITETDKLVCDKLKEPNIIYNKEADKIRANGTEYYRVNEK